MAARDLVLVGGSAGALEALVRVVASMPPWLRSAILVAIHRSPALPGAMPRTLARCGTLPADYAVDGEEIRPGRIYIAPPEHHLLVSGDRLRVTRGPREHGFRPAIDPLFRTAAREHGPRAVGVILSGVLDDGVEGLALIKQHGGVTIVQRTEDAQHAGMPAAAIAHVDVDHVLPAEKIGPLLARLSVEPTADVATTGAPDVAERGDCGLRSERPPGMLQPFSCPECGGSLWQSQQAGQPRFRCHVGHAFTMRTLTALQDGRLEQAMWTALRTLEEHAALRRRLAVRARGAALPTIANTYDAQAARSEEHATMLRRILVDPEPVGVEAATSSEEVSLEEREPDRTPQRH